MVNLRPMALSDVPEVQALVERTIRTSYHGVYSPRAIEFFIRYHGEGEIIGDLREGISLVAVQKNIIIGTATLRGDLITRVFVEPDEQGRGIGGRLMEALLEGARKNGLKAVRLDASVVSREVYEHMGFALVAERSHDLGDGDSLPYHEMVRRL
ncbi:MAG: GNAT family N-acetyltransferase [Methanomassiliicoccus sp.]|nr:GNAT family N-acetyltransferase [Methanomassiliicoccus sp.]